MICPRCGREISDTVRFCPGCGSPVIRQPAENGKTRRGFNTNYLIAGIIVVLIVIVLFMGLMVSEQMRRQQDGRNSREIQSKEVEIRTEEETDKDAALTEEIEEVQTNTENILVAAPADYMYLRQTPGLGEDKIAEVWAGQYLHWKGEAVTDGDRIFYKVTVEDTGQEGYLNADYCIRVDYRYDADSLSVVDVTDAMYTYDKMREDIEELYDLYSECLSYEVLGNSVDGREIYEVRLGSSDAEHCIFVQAAIHGREYMTAQLVMRMLEYYAANYECGSYHGKSYRELLENTAIYVIPMSNPDGVTISQLGIDGMYHEEIGQLVYDCYLRDREYLVLEEDLNGDWNWSDYYQQEDCDRAEAENADIISFKEYQKLWKSNANGVDLNTNFDAGWDDLDVKKEPAYGSYRGPYAESEPETQILTTEACKREYDYYISYHSKGQLIYYDVNGNEEATSEKSYALAASLQEVLKYTPLNTQKGYNVNLGGFSDWVQLELQGASVTIENGRHPCPLNIEEFDAIWYRNRESWAMLCESFY